MRRFILALSMCLFTSVAFAAQKNADLRSTLESVEKLFGIGLADRSPEWRCEIATQYVCSAKGCDQNPPSVWINLDFTARRYERCDSRGCDAYPMQSYTSGIYTSISLAQPGTFLKVVNDGSEFVEVASMGNVTFNSFGRCTPR